MDIRKIKKLQKLWKRALLLTHEGFWLQSEVAVEVFGDKRIDGDKDLGYAVLGKIGVEPNRKTKLLKMYEARKVITDRDVWLGAGWNGVQRLYSMPKKTRSKNITAIRKEVKKGAAPKAAAAKVLPKPEPKPRQGNPRLLEIVLSDLAKLVAFNPAVLPLLSEETRKALKPAKGKRKAS